MRWCWQKKPLRPQSTKSNSRHIVVTPKNFDARQTSSAEVLQANPANLMLLVDNPSRVDLAANRKPNPMAKSYFCETCSPPPSPKDVITTEPPWDPSPPSSPVIPAQLLQSVFPQSQSTLTLNMNQLSAAPSPTVSNTSSPNAPTPQFSPSPTSHFLVPRDSFNLNTSSPSPPRERPKSSTFFVPIAALPVAQGETPEWWAKTIRNKSISGPLNAEERGRRPSAPAAFGGESDWMPENSLALLLRDTVHVEDFRKFLSTAICCENLLFWEAADEAIRNPSISLIENIHSEFIQEFGNGTVNLSSNVRNQLTKYVQTMLETGTISDEVISALVKAQNEIFDLLEKDMLPRFLADGASSRWHDSWKKKKQTQYRKSFGWPRMSSD
eukprot:c11830_g1_i1.p1 GENE.c11830_g1_i1~~c11830_g1_i1.p1  ORF type:complete len:383 (+),score=67.60 c11830_g1_i1:424-1572(+)